MFIRIVRIGVVGMVDKLHIGDGGKVPQRDCMVGVVGMVGVVWW